MKFRFFAAAVATFISAQAMAAGDINSVLPSIKALAANPTVVAAVKAQNSKGLTLDAIKGLDTAWIEQKGKIPEADALMANESAGVLKQAEGANPAFKESILTDNQGANVAISKLTSDYWQGDEPKFVNAFADGAGKDYIARPKKDASTGEVIAQVSVPVMDGGKAVGTLTVGVDLNLIK